MKKQDAAIQRTSPDLGDKSLALKHAKYAPQEKPFVKDSLLNSTLAPQHQPILQKSDLMAEKIESKPKVQAPIKERPQISNAHNKSPSVIRDEPKQKSPISFHSKDTKSKSPRPNSDNKELAHPVKSPLTARAANSKSPIVNRDHSAKSPYSDLPLS